MYHSRKMCMCIKYLTLIIKVFTVLKQYRLTESNMLESSPKSPGYFLVTEHNHWKVGHVEVCPGKMPQTSSGGWLNFQGPTPCSLVQSGTDTEPLDTTHRCSPRFLPYMGRPGLDTPGVLQESQCPIKAFINGP